MRVLCCAALALLLSAGAAFAVAPGKSWKNSLKPDGKPGPLLNLASGGEAHYVIVLPAQPTTQEEKAAADLAKYLTAIAAAPFKVVREGSGYKPSGQEISVGRTELLRNSGVAAAGLDLGREGYAIDVKGKTLYLAGGTKRGPIYAVYALLEEDLGCRWYDRQAAPTLPSIPELKIGPVVRHFVPVLNIRDPFYWDAFDADWAIANRANFTWQKCIPDEWGGANKHPADLFVHTYNALLPPGEYFEKHPEYFSEIDGKRQALQLCVTNPDVIRIVTERVLKLLRENPGSEYISVSPNDWTGYCECANCKAIDDAEGTKAGSLITFCNKIAEAVEKEFPQAKITTLAYLGTFVPPKTIRPRHNVVIQLCTDSHAWSNPFRPITETGEFRKAMRAWHAIGATMHIWDYTVNYSHYSLPMPNMPVVTPDIQFFIDHGAAGVLLQGAYQGPGGENAIMRSWVWAKQLWDPSRPTLPLMKDFVYGYYGDAAEPIWQYNRMLWDTWETQHAAQIKEPKKPILPGSIRYEPTSSIIPDSYCAESAKLFAEAEKLAKDPETLRRVKLAKLPYLYTRICREVGFLDNHGQFVAGALGKTPDPKARAECVKLLDELEQTVKREKIAYFAEGSEDALGKIDVWRARLAGEPPSASPKDPPVPKGRQRMTVDGEGLVLAGQTPGTLCFDSVVPGTLTVRSTYLPDQGNTTTYEEGRDYVVDYRKGTVARTAESRIPDFSTNMLYGQKNFDHTKFAGHGNNRFFAWVDYQTETGQPFTSPTDQSALLPKTIEKLRAGGPFKVIAYGDSITAGGEASTESLRFPNRYVESLRKRFPKAEITLENGATGGDTSAQGLERLEEKVLTRKPDLVLLAFGMNDHNIAAYGVPLGTFERNLAKMIKAIRDRTGAELIVLSAFPPNPDWAFGSHQMEKYAEAAKRVAAEQKCAFADVYSVWTMVLERKDPSSMLGNNINHPNDFGHWLYLQALEAVGF